MKKQFVIIDDDATYIFLTEHLLKKLCHNCTVTSFIYSDKALEYIKSNIHTLENAIVLLDLNMPVLDGFQILQVINSLDHKLEVYIVSSSLKDKNKIEKLEYPFIMGYLVKPLNIELISNTFKPPL